jgi:DNA-binding response OmpR family regulator
MPPRAVAAHGRDVPRPPRKVTALRSVLLVDGAADTDAVLRAVLERRGARVRRTRSHLLAAQSDRPDVVVIDIDGGSSCETERAFGATPQVVLGSQRVAVDDEHARFLEKPFEFPELIRAVEELLDARPAA